MTIIKATSEKNTSTSSKAPPFDLPVRIMPGHGWSPKNEFNIADINRKQFLIL